MLPTGRGNRAFRRSPARAWSAQSTKTAAVSSGSSMASSVRMNFMPRATNASRRGTGSGFTQTAAGPSGRQHPGERDLRADAVAVGPRVPDDGHGSARPRPRAAPRTTSANSG